ncbi:MAG TPA: alpha/beta fold hydrolase, partial [Symbiobacteriaceae bacterium]|nr:alpha/beta fold hydrolase [Symbiobacteriaceae bacterium]
MGRRPLVVLLLLVLAVGCLTPALTLAEPPPVPLVLIHGHGGSVELTWKTAIPFFEEHGYRRGSSLFAVELSETRAADRPLGLLDDAQMVLAQIRDIIDRTGAHRVDLVGHSRGGLIARLIATGDTAGLVRRVVTLNTPHTGALRVDELQAMVAGAGIQQKRPLTITVPADLQSGSAALALLRAREERFADRRVPALTLATTWRKGVSAVLKGNDGAVSLASQLGWEGAAQATFALGPTPEEIDAILRSDLAAGLLVWKSPHLQSHESPEVLGTVARFLSAPGPEAYRRPCDPACQDWAALRPHWSAAELMPWMDALVPYSVAPGGHRLFEPDRLMTRAEFVYGLGRALGLQEHLSAPAFADLQGHWAFGWVGAALKAKLLDPADRFEPDRPITRAEAAAMVARVKGLPGGSRPSRFHDVRGHLAEAEIETLVALGLL